MSWASSRASDPDTALAALACVRILCALRRGRYGVEGIKARVEARLRREGRPAGEWTHGRPVLVTANDPHSGLFNGDVGVLLNRQDGRGVMAWFPSLQDPRSVPLAALPSHDTAWAMTVHRSQGSEFESVLCCPLKRTSWPGPNCSTPASPGPDPGCCSRPTTRPCTRPASSARPAARGCSRSSGRRTTMQHHDVARRP